MEQSYDNTAAHTELKAMMNRSERLSLYFTIDQYGYEAIRVESKTTKNFAYQIDQAAFAWVMNYLMKGETEDFNVKPEQNRKHSVYPRISGQDWQANSSRQFP